MQLSPKNREIAVDVETAVHPPEPDTEDDEDLPSIRLSVTALDVDNAHFDAAIQLFGDDATNPDRVAAALLRAALALAALLGPDYNWATVQRFAVFDGTAGSQIVTTQ